MSALRTFVVGAVFVGGALGAGGFATAAQAAKPAPPPPPAPAPTHLQAWPGSWRIGGLDAGWCGWVVCPPHSTSQTTAAGARLTDHAGVPLSGKPVSFLVASGVSCDTTTDADGQAHWTCAVPQATDAGFTVRFGGDSANLASEASAGPIVVSRA